MKVDDKPEHPFNKNVKVSLTETMMIVESDGIPNHKTAQVSERATIRTGSRSSITASRFRGIPRSPRSRRRLRLGPIGVALNGIPFYNQYNREGRRRRQARGVRFLLRASRSGRPLPLPQVSGLREIALQRHARQAFAAGRLCLRRLRHLWPARRRRQAADRPRRVQRPQRQRARLSLSLPRPSIPTSSAPIVASRIRGCSSGPMARPVEKPDRVRRAIAAVRLEAVLPVSVRLRRVAVVQALAHPPAKSRRRTRGFRTGSGGTR